MRAQLIRERLGDRALALTVSLLITVGFIELASLIPGAGQWYSTSLDYRLQTEALFAGRLAVAPTPFQAWHDWALANGMQQVWGLGVPLLRLPFEALARLFSQPAFPDRVVLALMVWLTALMLWNGLTPPEEDPDERRSMVRRPDLALATGSAVCVALYSPGLISLMNTRFQVYEEAVAFNCLWALMCLGLLLSFCKQASPQLLLVLAALAGYGAMIRVTGALHGLTTFAIALWIARTRKISNARLAVAASLFLVWPVVLLITNAIRFGAPLEFGYQMNATNIPWSEYMQRFDSPFRYEPVSVAARELVAALVGVGYLNGYDFFALNIHPWVSNTIRFREHYFIAFGLPSLSLMLVAWALAGLRISKRPRWLEWWRADPRIWVLLCWSIAVFILCFVFYLKLAAISSRYLVDFVPAVVAALLALLIVGGRAISRMSNRRIASLLSIALSLFALASVLYGATHRTVAPSYWRQPPLTLGEVEAKLAAFKAVPLPIPARYECRRSSKVGIPSNLDGWKYDSDCTVDVVSVLILTSPQCVRLEIEKLSDAPGRPGSEYSTREIQAKLDLRFMERVRANSEGERETLVFCDRRANRDTAATAVPMLLTIGWVNLEHFGTLRPPVRLISVEKVSSPQF